MARFRVLLLTALVTLIILSGCVDVPTTDTPGESPSVTMEMPASTTTEPISTNPAVPMETDE